MIVFLCK